MAGQILSILALFVSTAFLLAGGGLHGILLPVRAQLEGFSTFEIGLIGTGWAIGFTAGCLLIPILVRRVGHVRSFAALAAMLAIVVLANGLIVEAYSWIILRAIAGLCFSGSYMIIESWLNERITNKTRGTIFSIYMMVTQISMMGGQYLLTLADPAGYKLFMIGAILYAFAVLPTAVSSAQSPAPLTKVDFDLKYLYRNSPVAAVGAVLTGIIASAWNNFAPVFGTMTGMSTASIASLIAVAMVGSILFQYPMGRLSDKMDRRYVIIAITLLGTLMGFVLSQYGRTGGETGIVFLLLILIFGGAIYPIYGIIVAHANDFSEAEDFVKTSSGLLVLFGAGTMIGPLLTAAMMELMGSFGLFATIGGAHLFLAIYVGYRIMKRTLPEDLETVDFQTVPLVKAHTPETLALDPRSDAQFNTSEE